MKELLILGAGTAGTMMANKLRRALPDAEWHITVVDRDDQHIYQPGLLFVPFGAYRADEIVRPRTTLFDPGIRLVLSGIARLDAAARKVWLVGGELLTYDFLIVATGTRVLPEATEGLAGEGWHQSAFDFYTLEGASALNAALERFQGGRLVVHITEMPIKCPVAPLEFALLADAWFTRRGMRDRVEIVYATPLEGAFTKPRASAMLGDLLNRRNIQLEPEFSVSKVDGALRRMEAWDGRTLDYDLLVTIPTHAGAEVIDQSGLGDAMGFLPTDRHTLVAKEQERVFAIGDATDLPTSKAGSVAHFQSEVLFENLMRAIEGLEPLPLFDGHANCFIETGHDKAVLIDFNYQTEPLPGRFPLPMVGPFDLLAESQVNHWGKLAFRWLYWNVLLPGKELPLDHRMAMSGKWSA